MKAKEVLSVLQITRPTLTKYVKNGSIKVTVMGNGRYDYDADSVYKMLNKEIERKTYLYARVTTSKEKKDLERQIAFLKVFCIKNGYPILSGKVCRVITMYRDRITRIGFDFFSTVFKRYGCEIIVINEVGSEELDYIEIDKECNSLLDCYCSSAKNKFLKSIEKPDR